MNRDIASSTAQAYNGFVRAFNYGCKLWNEVNYLNSCFMPREIVLLERIYFFLRQLKIA